MKGLNLEITNKAMNTSLFWVVHSVENRTLEETTRIVVLLYKDKTAYESEAGFESQSFEIDSAEGMNNNEALDYIKSLSAFSGAQEDISVKTLKKIRAEKEKKDK